MSCNSRRRFDAFVDRFNRDRPHQTLAMKVPADVYTRSARVYRGLDELTYPFHDATAEAVHWGKRGARINTI